MFRKCFRVPLGDKMRISILGHGVVGKGVWDILQSKTLKKKYEVRNVLVKKGEKTADFMTESFDTILNDDSEIVIECMGGVDPAYEFATKCIQSGKSFITSNKALVAAHGIDLLNLAQKNNKAFLFSAACGGSIPILQNLCLARKTDEILWAGGILNGTTNYILDSMDRKGLTFNQALAEAKALGYAEFDPTADLSGMDTMRKIILISMVTFDILPNSDYNVEGIQSVSINDFKVAKELGYTIKLIGCCGLSSGLSSGRLYAYVQPVLFSKSNFHSSVYDNINLVQYQGNNSGIMSFMGQGAGRYPTASAILRDVTSFSEGQMQMLNEKCTVGFVNNDAQECVFSYFVRVEEDFVNEIESKVGVINRFKTSHNTESTFTYLQTAPASVKTMHALASNLRSRGSKLFFAQMEPTHLSVSDSNLAN